MSAGKVLLGVLAGLAAGAAVGILLAPDKGTNTRKKITKKGDDYVEELKSKFDDFIESITDKFDSANKEADNLIRNGKSKIKGAKNDLENAIN